MYLQLSAYYSPSLQAESHLLFAQQSQCMNKIWTNLYIHHVMGLFEMLHSQKTFLAFMFMVWCLMIDPQTGHIPLHMWNNSLNLGYSTMAIVSWILCTCAFRISPYLHERFSSAFDAQSVQLVSVKGNHFVLVNSMAMEGDGCFLCRPAELQLQIISSECCSTIKKC